MPFPPSHPDEGWDPPEADDTQYGWREDDELRQLFGELYEGLPWTDDEEPDD